MSNPLQVLVVDDNPRMASVLADILELHHYAVEIAHSGAEALEIAARLPLHCAISDIRMPGMDGIDLCKQLVQIQPDLLCVLMTAYSHPDRLADSRDQGILAVLEKPLDIEHLLSFLDLLRQKRTVALVDDDPAFVYSLGDVLESQGFAVKRITDAHRVPDALSGEEEIVLLDMKLNDNMTGFDVLQNIRTVYDELPVLLVTGYRLNVEEAIQQALTLNAYTCIDKPVQISNLLTTLEEIRRLQLKKALKRQ